MEVSDAAYSPPLPAGIPGGGRTPRPGQRQVDPRAGGRPGVSSEALRHWLRQDDADGGRGQPGDLTADERDELRRLRREVKVLQQEREILRKAAAYFAKETL